MKSLISICSYFLTTKAPHIADRFCVDFNAYLINHLNLFALTF